MKHITILLNLILVVNFLNAQDYENLFGSESTYWSMTYGNLWGTSSTEHHIIGDTIIDDKSYEIINGYEGGDGIIGFIRQDSLSEKAWYRNNQTTEEILIMDLSLELGDSLFIQGVWNGSHKHYIVDSVYIKDGRKHIQFDFPINISHIQYTEKFTLIEGVVSNMGFRYQDNDFVNGIPSILLCAFKNEEKVFGDVCVITSIENISTIENSVEIYPNPVYDKLNIKLTDRNFNGDIHIIDTYGRLHHTVRDITNDEVIDMSGMDDGIYFLCIQDLESGKQLCDRIIKVTDHR